MAVMLESDPNRFAVEFFDGLSAHYDRLGGLLSMGQDRRWRRAMIDHVVLTRPARVLDVATGPGGIALDMHRRTGAEVVGVDLSHEMLGRAVSKAKVHAVTGVTFAQGRAEELPLADDEFDALTVTYLLRYVKELEATLAEAARVRRPGGVLSSMEFGVPAKPWSHVAWWGYTRTVLPVVGWLNGGREWYRAGRFLGPNITAFYRRYPVATIERLWANVGLSNVQSRAMSLGGGIVTWDTKDLRA